MEEERVPQKITLKPGDTFKETTRSTRGNDKGESRLAKVTGVHRHRHGSFLRAHYEVDPEGVHSLTQIDADEVEDGSAILPKEFTTAEGRIHHRIEKVSALESTKWSYED